MHKNHKNDRPNVLLLIIDALRFDVFENAEMAEACWPNLWRLARNGDLLPANASAPATQFVCPALFTLRHPLDDGGYNYGILHRPGSIAERFKEAGYRAMMHSLCAQLGVSNGYQRGFDSVHGIIDYKFVVMYFGQNILRHRVKAFKKGDITKKQMIRVIESEYRAMLEGIVSDYKKRKIQRFEIKTKVINFFIHRGALAEIALIKNDPDTIIERYQEIWPYYYAAYLGSTKSTLMKRLVSRFCIGLPFRLFDVVNRIFRIGTALKYGRCTLASDGIEGIKDSLIPGDKPWFCYVHWMDVHDCTYINRFFHKIARFRFLPRWKRFHQLGMTRRHFKYDAALMDLDRYVGRVVDYLECSSQSANTVVVATSDHAFRKAGGTERSRKKLGLRLNWEDLSIPIIVSGPTPKVPARTGVFDTTSIGASCLIAAGIECDPEIRSKSIFAGGMPAVISESAGRGYCDVENDDLYFAVTTKLHRLIAVLSGQQLYLYELYDLAVDPMENNNLVGDSKIQKTIDELISFLWQERKEILIRRGLDAKRLSESLIWKKE